MPKTATVFKDIGKLCSDLLSKDYKVGKTIVEVESKTPAGITFTPTATKSGESVAGTLKAAYPLKGVGDLEATFGTSGSLEASAKMPNAFMPGLTLTAECTKAAAGKGGLLASANCIAEYKSELLACKTSYDIYKADLLGARAPPHARAHARICCDGAVAVASAYPAALAPLLARPLS